METRWRETLDPKNGGGTVQVKIELIYSNDKKRPDRFMWPAVCHRSGHNWCIPRA